MPVRFFPTPPLHFGGPLQEAHRPASTPLNQLISLVADVLADRSRAVLRLCMGVWGKAAGRRALPCHQRHARRAGRPLRRPAVRAARRARAGFKIPRRKVCRFESGLRHQQGNQALAREKGRSWRPAVYGCVGKSCCSSVSLSACGRSWPRPGRASGWRGGNTSTCSPPSCARARCRRRRGSRPR